MKKDLEIFENRRDDWLAKQRQEENKTSVWDIDEGKKLKEEHAKKHQEYLENYNVKRQESEIPKKRKTKNFQELKLSLIIKFLIFMAICIILEYFGIILF